MIPFDFEYYKPDSLDESDFRWYSDKVMHYFGS